MDCSPCRDADNHESLRCAEIDSLIVVVGGNHDLFLYDFPNFNRDSHRFQFCTDCSLVYVELFCNMACRELFITVKAFDLLEKLVKQDVGSKTTYAKAFLKQV